MSVKKKFKGLSDKAVGWLFIGPTVLLLLAINIYPLIYAIKMSFTNFYANKIGRVPEFVGLKNYIKVLNKEACLLYTSPSPRDATLSRMPSSA